MSLSLRPHHLLDILCDYGHGLTYQPHPYGHALHTVAAEVLSNLDLEISFVIAADAICRPCRHLLPNGQCDDVLGQLPDSPTKQAYNDALDWRLWAYLKLDQQSKMTFRTFCQRVSQNLPGIEKICTHPGEEEAYRLAGLQQATHRLNIGNHLHEENRTGASDTDQS
jgi:hypothetical protein